MATTRNYQLPNKYHDVVEDITTMRETFAQIDSDIAELEAKTKNVSTTVKTSASQMLQATIANPEIKNISADRFVIIDGSDVGCIDGSGNSGGLQGQCTVKKSNENFDQGWSDILETSANCQTVKVNATEASGSDTVILCESDNSSEELKPEFVYLQSVSDVEAQNNESVVFVDAIEEAKEVEQLATKFNNGIVKIGDGISVDNGIISAESFSNATKESHGIVQIGSGFSVDNTGTITAQGITHASAEKYGVVKLGSEFTTNSEGALTLTTETTESTIYGLGTPKLVENGNIYLTEDKAWYRAFVSTDLQFSINIGFAPEKDFTFLLEIVSTGSFVVNFDANIRPVLNTMPINRGTTKIYFTKCLGIPHFEAVVRQQDAPEPICLTPSGIGTPNSNFLMYAPQGGNWNPVNLLKDSYNGYSDIKELMFEFSTLVCVDYVRYLSQSQTTPMREFILRGSNDKKTWTTLLYRNGEVIYGDVYTDVKGCFRYYNVLIGYTSDNNKPGIVKLYGTQIDNNESEITYLTPLMSSNTTAFATLTASNIKSNGAQQITDTDVNTYMTVGYDSNNDRWIKYELTTPSIANLLELYYRGGDAQANWFMLEGSNDDSEWTLLLERQYYGNTLFNNGYRIVYFAFENEVEYKYYRLRCMNTNSTSENWEIAGFKLHKRSIGKHNFYNIAPNMQSAEQDGYIVSASGRWNASYAEWMAFDGDKSTAWSGSGSIPAWIQIKCPNATVANCISITARSSDLSEMPKNFTIEASNDGELFDILYTQTDVSWTANETKSFTFENSTAYLYYRLSISATNALNVSLSELAFGVRKYEYKRLLNKYEYLIPQLTANTSTNGYVASASSEYSNNEGAWRAFDRQSSQWTTVNGVNSDVELKIQLPEAIACNLIKLETSNAYNRLPRTFRIEASNDDINWTVLHQELDNANLSTNTSYYYENPHKQTAFKYYRLYILTNNGDGFISLQEFQLIHHYTISEY